MKKQLGIRTIIELIVGLIVGLILFFFAVFYNKQEKEKTEAKDAAIIVLNKICEIDTYSSKDAIPDVQNSFVSIFKNGLAIIENYCKKNKNYGDDFINETLINGFNVVINRSQDDKKIASFKRFVSQIKNNGFDNNNDTIYTKLIASEDVFPSSKRKTAQSIEDNKKQQTAVNNYDEIGTKAREFNRKGLVESNLENYNKAIEYYNKAIELNPKYYICYMNRSISYDNIGNREAALNDAKTAVEIQSTGTNCRWLGNLLYEQEDYQNAIYYYTKAINLFDKSKSVDYSDGKNITAVSAGENKASTYNYRGMAYYQKKNYKAAFEDFNNATALAPNNKTYELNKNNVSSYLQ